MSLFAAFFAAGLVAFCYFYVDRPVAFFVADHGVNHFVVLRWLTYPEPFVQLWSPLLIVVLMVRRAWAAPRPIERALLAACIGVIIADQFRESLQVPFSRLWPDTWINDNLSLIHDGDYGFYPFHGGAGYASFPSGHTARTAAVCAVFWVAYPRGRFLWAAIGIIMAAALVGMNYHFVGDTIGGAFVGGMVGAYAAAFSGLGLPVVRRD